MGTTHPSAIKSCYCSYVILVYTIALTSVFGVVIDDYVVYSASGSPYIITDDIVIAKRGKLILEPGITLRFDPGVGITVRGVLDAQGREDNLITLTSSTPPQEENSGPSLRLIDGPAPTRGRLQMLYKNKWRSVCTNSKNWTDVDREVTCRQMGYSGGFFYEWQDRPNNDTDTLLYETPSCVGHETNLMQCDWYTHAIGGGVCDMHPDMGLACGEYHALWRGTNHWRGIEFDRAQFTDEMVRDGLLFQKVSTSILKHTVVQYAGMGPKRELTAAIMSLKVPPRMYGLTVRRNVYTGINVTLPGTFVNITHSTITHNLGIGIYVNTSVGSVFVEGQTLVSDNFGGGIKYNLHHLEPDTKDWDTVLSFCSGASNPAQTYPLTSLFTQRRHTHRPIDCDRTFFINDPNLVFTIQFTYISADEDDTASIEVRDWDRNGKLLTRFSMRNDTFPPSVVSKTNGIHVHIKAKARRQVIAYMEISAHLYKIPDIIVNNSVIERNLGHGLSVDNMGSLVLVHNSKISDNFYGSGLNVRRGAGDVNVTYSVIRNNLGDGVNVTYEGGVQNITASTIAYNTGRGVAIWFNESGHDTEIMQETDIAFSKVTGNLDIGVLVGNFCRDSFINISTNTFSDSRQPALQVESCWKNVGESRTLLIGHNSFIRNDRLAVKVSPAANMNMSLHWNEFHRNKRGTVKIFNKDILEIVNLPFQGLVKDNTFTLNRGKYVLLLGLNVRSFLQSLFVTRNTIKRNIVSEPYLTMASRSQAAGVVCLGSPSIELYRNLIENPESIYEISSHALDQSAPINATFNWIGTKDEYELFERIFDRRDRYTLALINFHPFLLSDNNFNTPVISPAQHSEPNFFNSENEKIIGGEINGNIVLTKPSYQVVRDIYVHHTGILTIPFGTTLEFKEAVGIMVTGTLRTEGSGDKKVRFTLSGTTEMEKIKALIEAGRIDELTENMTSTDKTPGEMDEIDENSTYSGPDIPLKLVGGRDEMEGRLLVYSNGGWGSICNHGWKEDTAAIACQQMGYVLNSEDWYLESGDMPIMGSDSRILLSNVQCDEFETDILSCESDTAEDLENSCTHSDDVGLKCYPKTWAGIRFGMTAQESHVKGVIIEKAGLLDYTSRIFKSALQVDFNQHVLQDLTIQHNSHDGIGIVRNNIYAISNPEARLLRNCILRNNRRHGISLRQLGANITDSRMVDNVGSGIHFDPYLKREEQRELTGWLKLRKDDFQAIPDVAPNINLRKDKHLTFITKNLVGGPSREVTFKVSTSHANVIGIQILNPILSSSTENILIYDYPEIFDSKDVDRWDFKTDLIVFPTTSSSYAITIKYTSGSHAIGDAMFVLTAVDRKDVAQDGDLIDFRPKVPVTFIEGTHIYRNGIGLSTLHYNRYLTDDEDHMLRNSNETIALIRSLIVDNSRQAVYTLSPFRAELDNRKLGELTFMFNDTTIVRNGRGIEQFSWDIRDSNNLFHWIFENVTLEGNGGSGVSLALPYVWQYNENFTHTVYVNKSRFLDNTNFDFTIDGHFARVNITKSIFEKNVCSKGVFAVTGMEKEMFIRENIFKDNVGLYIVSFSTASQSEILGNVFAYFEHNEVQNNRHPPQLQGSDRSYIQASTAVSLKGIQKVNITYNLFGNNEMDYELLAGLYTARINNILNVRANWWGSKELSFIKERIFDFDDWNNYALANFRPFLIAGSFNARLAHGIEGKDQYIGDESLGGRITENLILKAQSKPYIVRSDLTIMPEVTLVLEPGVELEFFPSVGLLVLGKLKAIGRREKRIIMRPVDTSTAIHYRVGRQIRQREHIDVRLCIEEKCEGRSDGFLDMYNSTTQQWVPVCDDRFAERNAQVVCHQLGFNRVNVFYARDRRIEMYPNALMRIRSWPEPIQCQGMESSLHECPVRMNGQIYDHVYECPWNGDFVYINCGALNLPSDDFEYWGGVRFSVPDFEYNNLYERIHQPHYSHTHHSHEKIINLSILEYVDIIGAGILHNEKSPAILSFYETPSLLDVSISNSAYDGVSLISAHHQFEMLYNRFFNNLGVGVTLMGLTGETRESDESSFIPVKNLRLPYNIFGMVDICDSSKELLIEERVKLYYKYDNRPVDCVKIFTSTFDVKKFGFRLLQFNLFNSTTDPSVPDRIIIYDGDIYNETSKIIKEFNSSSSDSMKFIKTQGTRMSVQLHATGASGSYGFVAEIVTLPISTIGIDRDLLHNMTYNEFYDNREGAVFVATAGEVTPWLTIAWSRMERNGLHLYGNITNTIGAATMDLQNMRTLYFKNNLVRNNVGGLNIRAGSLGAATNLWANITNNLFELTQQRPSLYIESKERSAYQQAFIAFNDFSWAYIPYHDVISLAQIVSDFSYNYVHSNLGRHIFDVYGFEKVRLPVYQSTSHNSFAKNRAVDPTYQATVVAGSAGQQYIDNVFYNLDNAYEMVAVNESVRCNMSSECDDIAIFQDFHGYADVARIDVWKTPIDARNNWWGFNTTSAVSGRIHDKLDNEYLLKVDYREWKMNNFTLLHGCEPGYNLVGSSCYLYVGSPITYAEAKEFCRKDNASLPFLQRDFNEVRRWIHRQQPEYLWDYDMVWVQHYDLVSDCAAFVNYRVRSAECELNLPFICESDSGDSIDASAWVYDSLVIGAVAATFFCIVLVVACLACWICKSRHRRKERLVRRSSIRASIRSNRSVLSSTSGGFSDFGQRRRIIEEPNIIQAVKTESASNGSTLRANGMNGSFDSIAKSNLNYSVDEDPSYMVYETTQTPSAFIKDIDTRFANDPDLENQNVNAVLKPTFDLSYHNAGFKDTSTFASNTSTFETINGQPQEPWADLNGHLATSSTHSSFRDRSVGGSTTHLGLPQIPDPEERVELPLRQGDIHMAATLPRDMASAQRFVSADVLQREPHQPPLVGQQIHFDQGLSQSQPLETAM